VRENKMAGRVFYLVFILPVIFSIIFGSVVLADVLQEPGRRLILWPGNYTSEINSSTQMISIIGLEQQYTTNSPIQIQIKIDDSMFDCGDLYITIHSVKTNEIVTQNGFFEQCFAKNNELLPVDDNFSEIIDIPGQYELIAEIHSQNQKHNVSTSEKFTIK
jgi:hypothetical protein